MKVLKNVPLKEYTTFRTGGPASFFVEVTTSLDLQKAVQYAKRKKIPVFILGGGSNILVQDEGFPGLVIKMAIKGIEEQEKSDTDVEIVAGAGENWDEFVAHTVSRNLFGIENLSLIPGTVGAAPVQNIGAYGTEIMNVISWVEVFDQETKKIKRLINEECGFTYRDSMFKKPHGKKYVITRVAFVLHKKSSLNTSYKDVYEYIKTHTISPENLTLSKIREIVINIRKAKLPDILVYGTAGSFFKNPIVPKNVYEDLLKKFPDMPHFVVDKQHVKIPAAWMLDKICGFRGYKEERVGTYENQALVLVNVGNATSKEILNLAGKMTVCVKEKTGITLEREVQLVP
jgi:UDP-N-acetylmuramate dehydrogenase